MSCVIKRMWLYVSGSNIVQALCVFNPLNANLNPTCHLLTLLAAHPILHISRIRVKHKGCDNI
jgi:hypothetical protein